MTIIYTYPNFEDIKHNLWLSLDVLKSSNDKEILIQAYTAIKAFLSDPKGLGNFSYTVKKEFNQNKHIAEIEQEIRNKTMTLLYFISTNQSTLYKKYQNQYNLLIKNMNQKLNLAKKYTTLSDYQIGEILYNYYLGKSSYDASLFVEFIENSKIFECQDKNILGCAIFSTTFEDSYIKIRKENNFNEMLNIIHELAHVKFYELLLKDKESKLTNEYYYENLFIEVYPKIEELRFIKYLINNNMFLDDVKKYLITDTLYFKHLLDQALQKYDNNTLPYLLDIKSINGYMLSSILYSEDSIDNMRKTYDVNYLATIYDEPNFISSTLERVELVKRLSK